MQFILTLQLDTCYVIHGAVMQVYVHCTCRHIISKFHLVCLFSVKELTLYCFLQMIVCKHSVNAALLLGDAILNRLVVSQ